MHIWPRVRAVALPPLLRLFQRLPAPLSEEILALLGIVRGFLDPRQLRQALNWASSHSTRETGKWALALSLLAHRGRFLAEATLLSFPDPATLLRRCVFEGVEHLEAASRGGGAILLGFHMGSAITYRALRLRGYRIHSVGQGIRVAWPRPPAVWTQDPGFNRGSVILWTDRASRVSGLYRLRGLLTSGEIVGMYADGRDGREAFRISLPGRAAVIRAGWFALRRQTGAVTLPVLTHRERRKVVVTIHPPLPPPTSDPDHDITVCRDVLTRILAEYVRRFPEQCLSLVFWGGSNPHGNLVKGFWTTGWWRRREDFRTLAPADRLRREPRTGELR